MNKISVCINNANESNINSGSIDFNHMLLLLNQIRQDYVMNLLCNEIICKEFLLLRETLLIQNLEENEGSNPIETIEESDSDSRLKIYDSDYDTASESSNESII